MSGIDLSTLNAEQRAIVTTLDAPLFVEAGAGSGKTFTLTRRIAWALSPGSGKDGGLYLDDLSQVLVITFTNAAAREIKERVRSTLRAAGMREAALSVDSAWISTIHGMCSRILKRHAFDLGLDPAFKVASTNEENELRNLALDEVVGSAFRERSAYPGLEGVLETYGLGRIAPTGKAGLIGLVDKVLAAGASTPGGFDALVCPGPANVAEEMSNLLLAYESLCAAKLTKAAKEKALPALELLRAFDELAPGERTAEAALGVLAKVKEVGFPQTRSKDFGELAKDARRAFEEAHASLLLSSVWPAAQACVDLARAVDVRYAELKASRSVLDNDDLIGLALRAVKSSPEVAADYAGRFRLVMVDEFQDTDARQLELISLLAGPGARHLATVGDAQQSIYRFRGADVGVFRGRGAALPKSQHVRLAVNYRSHAEVLSFVDAVCGGSTGLGTGVLDDFMHLDPNAARKDGYRARELPRINLELVRGAFRTGAGRTAVLAQAMAERLRAFADAGERPGDMALLLGSTTHAAAYIDALRARGLECVVTGGSTFTTAPEVQVMAALLHVLANPHDTQSGLFPLLTSEMFELDADDLVQLGSCSQPAVDAPTKRSLDRGLEVMDFFRGAEVSERVRLAHDVLFRARQNLRRLPVADVCMQAVRESGWLARLEAEGGEGASREANVLAAVGYIRDLTDELGLGPARAASEFDLWLSMSKIPPASLQGGESNAVRIMTVHASKGLEFPICAVAECWSDPRSATGVLSCGLEGGGRALMMVPKLPSGEKIDLSRSVLEGDPQAPWEWYLALREQDAREEAAEKTRLLYVALTRAREALVVGMDIEEGKTGIRPALAGLSLEQLFGGALPEPGEHALSYAGGELGQVRCVRVTKSEGCFEADSAGALAELDGLFDVHASLSADPAIDGAQPARSFGMYDVERNTLAEEVYLETLRGDVFSYSSVHELLRPSNEVFEDELVEKPVVADADRATGLGSAFHELAQAIVESGQRFPSDERIAASKRYWRLSERAGARLDAALACWWRSDVRSETLKYDLVRAEVPFFSRVNSHFGGHVEGAIDLLATNAGDGHAFVVDYKTGDRGLSLGEIEERHRMQANFYAHVLMAEGFSSATCSFVCVELEGEGGQPVVVRYDFGPDRLPDFS